MKAIRIILAVLIVIGLVSLLTQKKWVPHVVQYILSHEQAGSPTSAVPTTPTDTTAGTTTGTPSQHAVQLTDGEQCYAYSHDAEASAPYSVHELLDITITGTAVTGKKTGNQAGPDMTNGYSGTFTGTLANNAITGVYSYTVEGSANKEQEIYRAGVVGLEKLRYPLIEKGGMLVPDTTQQPTILSYARVECHGSN